MRRLVLLLTAAVAVAAAPPPPAPVASAPPAAIEMTPDRRAFFDIYRQLVETNTTLSAGNCTQAAQQIATRPAMMNGLAVRIVIGAASILIAEQLCHVG